MRLFFRMKDQFYTRRTAIIRFFQRGKRGWSTPDTWNLHIYLAQVIGESIASVARGQYGGCPYPFYEHEDGFAEWSQYLQKTSQAFLDYAEFMNSEESMTDIGNVKHAELIERMKHLFDHYTSIDS